MSPLPEGTVTLLFSDIEGSTLLLQRLGVRWGEALTAQRAILRSVFEAQGGHEMGTEGDSFFVVFATARAAVDAALEGQCRLGAYAWPDGVPLRVRMGVHTGEPRRHEDGYIGLDVHRAARIAATASGGQTVLSEATRTMLAGVDTGAEIRDLGWHRLKDLDQPEHLYDVVPIGTGTSFPPLRSLGSRARLPQPGTPLVGREDDLAFVRAGLESGANRVVTLVGPGGTGKTRLAVAAAASMEGVFPHGVFFVPLHTADRAALLWAGVAESVGAPVDTERPPQERALRFLSDRRALVVLDNLEQIPDADEAVAHLLRGAPQTAVLATSRRPLHLVEEHVYLVPPLGLPALGLPALGLSARGGHEIVQRAVGGAAGGAAAGPADLISARRSPAVELFVQRARMSAPTFDLTQSNVAHVVSLCRKLDGLPLSIELAAARAGLLSPRAMLSRIDHRLGTGVAASDRAPHQRTVGATIRWSYDLLEPVDQTVFRRLGVFSASFDLDTVDRVAASDGVDPLEVVARLVDLNLLHVVEGADGEPRVSMLQTIRSFARELLDTSPERDEVRLRHAQWCTGVAGAVGELLQGSAQMAALDRIQHVEEDVRTALDWCLVADVGLGAERTTVGLHLLSAMTAYWYRFGYVAEGRGWHERALAVVGTAESTEAVDVLHGMAVMLLQQNEVSSAEPLLRRALGLARQLGDGDRESRESNSLGIARREDGDLLEARRLIESSIRLAREVGSAQREATALSNVVTILMDAGDYDAAAVSARQAIEVDRSRGDPWGTAINQTNLTMALLRSDGPETAYRHLLQVGPGIILLADAELSINVVELLAATVAELAEPLLAARLLGTADAQRGLLGMPRSGPDAAHLDRSVNPARAQVSPDAWQRAYSDGRGWTVEEGLAAAADLRRTTGVASAPGGRGT